MQLQTSAILQYWPLNFHGILYFILFFVLCEKEAISLLESQPASTANLSLLPATGGINKNNPGLCEKWESAVFVG